MRRILRRWRWILGGLGVLVAALVGTGWLMFQHKPSWYQPVRPSYADMELAKADMANTYSSLGEQLSTTRAPFRFVLTQEQVNAWLAARENVDLKAREWLPPHFRDPMIAFEKDAIRLGVTYSGSSLQAVVSARLRIRVESGGIHARLDEVAGGSLGVPEALVRQALQAADPRVAAAVERSEILELDRNPPRLADLFEGVVLPSDARLPGGGQRFRVVKIEVQPGQLALTVERLASAHSRR